MVVQLVVAGPDVKNAGSIMEFQNKPAAPMEKMSTVDPVAFLFCPGVIKPQHSLSTGSTWANCKAYPEPETVRTEDDHLNAEFLLAVGAITLVSTTGVVFFCSDFCGCSRSRSRFHTMWPGWWRHSFLHAFDDALHPSTNGVRKWLDGEQACCCILSGGSAG